MRAVTVESEPGVGSLFRVFIPHEETELRDEPVETEDTLNGTERVLFIDDEEMIAEWGEASLARLGYAVNLGDGERWGPGTFFPGDPGEVRPRYHRSDHARHDGDAGSPAHCSP